MVAADQHTAGPVREPGHGHQEMGGFRHGLGLLADHMIETQVHFVKCKEFLRDAGVDGGVRLVHIPVVHL